MKNLKERDVFSYTFKDSEANTWTMSGFAIVEDGVLKDTWRGLDSYNKIMINEEDVDLVFLGNLDEYEKAHKLDCAEYLDKDTLDLSHANQGNLFFLRKDAVKSKEKRQKLIKRNMILAQRNLIEAARELHRLYNSDDESYIRTNEISVSDESYDDVLSVKFSKEYISKLLLDI